MEVGTIRPENSLYDFYLGLCVKTYKKNRGGGCTGGSFMGKNYMSITLPLKFRRQHIKYKQTVKISKA